MVNNIHGPNNNFRINGNASMRPPVRKIVIRDLMESTALKLPRLQWHLSMNSRAPEMLKAALSLKMPEIKSTKLEFCRMKDNEIINEADKMIRMYINDKNLFLGQNNPPTLLEFMQGTESTFSPVQFYSIHASWCSPSAVELKVQPDPKKREKFSNEIKNAYRNILFLTSAMEIMSKKHDFTVAIKSWLVKHFPQMDKEISPWNYLEILDAEDIYMTAQLLKYINEEMKVEFNRVKFDAIMGSDIIAYIKKDLVVINLPVLPGIKYNFTSSTKKQIITEK